VDRNGGHTEVWERFQEDFPGDHGDDVGFAMTLSEDGSIRVGWKSGQLNPTPDNLVPRALRQRIMDAIAEATGRRVYER
jgi:hypothetical protein